MRMLHDSDAVGTAVSWKWFNDLRRPPLIAVLGHAMICVGACRHIEFAGKPSLGYRVSDPAHPTLSNNWVTFPAAE